MGGVAGGGAPRTKLITFYLQQKESKLCPINLEEVTMLVCASISELWKINRQKIRNEKNKNIMAPSRLTAVF